MRLFLCNGPPVHALRENITKITKLSTIQFWFNHVIKLFHHFGHMTSRFDSANYSQSTAKQLSISSRLR
jgi:hypothetical protein